MAHHRSLRDPWRDGGWVTAVVITAFALPVLGLGLVETLGFLGVALLAAGAFVALNQAATAIFGRPGRLASIAVLVLAAATGIVSTLPGPLYVVVRLVAPVRTFATRG